jgi:hypothetical protein
MRRSMCSAAQGDCRNTPWQGHAFFAHNFRTGRAAAVIFSRSNCSQPQHLSGKIRSVIADPTPVDALNRQFAISGLAQVVSGFGGLSSSLSPPGRHRRRFTCTVPRSLPGIQLVAKRSFSSVDILIGRTGGRFVEGFRSASPGFAPKLTIRMRRPTDLCARGSGGSFP